MTGTAAEVITIEVVGVEVIMTEGLEVEAITETGMTVLMDATERGIFEKH